MTTHELGILSHLLSPFCFFLYTDPSGPLPQSLSSHRSPCPIRILSPSIHRCPRLLPGFPDVSTTSPAFSSFLIHVDHR